MDELIKVEKYEVADAEEKESRIVKIDLTSTDKGRAVALLDQIVDGFQILRDKLPEVEPEKRYYLDLTKEMKDKLESGEAWFTEKAANGKPMGQLRHRVDGKNVIMANPDIIAEQVPIAPKGDPKQLSNGIYQMALQQQMAEMSHEMDEIQHTVKRIEAGQMDDRFAKIEAGEQTLRLAYRAADEKTQKELVANAIPQLQEGSESIKKVIKRRLAEFDPVPSKGRSMRLKMWMSPTNYVEKKNREFDEIQDCFEYYDRAQKLLAISCMMLEEPGSMEEVFFQQEKFIKGLDTWKLESMKHLHYNIDFSNEWFCSPREYLDGTRLQYLDFTKENYDMVSIEVTGQQMLEVLDYYQKHYCQIHDIKGRKHHIIFSDIYTDTGVIGSRVGHGRALEDADPQIELIPLSFVCRKADGEMVTTQTLKNCNKLIQDNLPGIPFHMHGLRHTYGSNMVASGANFKDLQMLMGHSDISITLNVYAHVTEQSRKTAVNLLENSLDMSG